ncbi:MAG: hypothetical protein A2W25_11270 [candidate division Zixibacteria bacterium RBG_16_53_22]|nr:MAG: hypothetical protein A2W25_11270 [candidate division Zixibacteria bacterium RBG_16_53_22]
MNRHLMLTMLGEPREVHVLVGHLDRLLYGERMMTRTFAQHLNGLGIFKQIRLEWMLEEDHPRDYSWVPLESRIGGHSIPELEKLGDRQLNKSDRLSSD